MYCVNGESHSSLLIESTDSMIIHRPAPHFQFSQSDSFKHLTETIFADQEIRSVDYNKYTQYYNYYFRKHFTRLIISDGVDL